MQDAMQWEVVDENEGVVVHISDAGRKTLDAEQRDIAREHQQAEILTWTLAASVLAIAVLILIKAFGA